MAIKHIQAYSTLALVGAVALSTNLFAGEQSGNKIFLSLDANGDKKISQNELSITKRLSQNFGKYDLNKNGNIELTEFTAYLSAEAFTPVEEENEPIGAAPTP